MRENAQYKFCQIIQTDSMPDATNVQNQIVDEFFGQILFKKMLFEN